MIGWGNSSTRSFTTSCCDTTVNVFRCSYAGCCYTAPLMIVGGRDPGAPLRPGNWCLSLTRGVRAAFFAGVPTMYQMLTRVNWRTRTEPACGSAPARRALPVQLSSSSSAEKGVRFNAGFGMTVSCISRWRQTRPGKAGSIGADFFVDAAWGRNQPSLPPNTVGDWCQRPSIARLFHLPGANGEVLDEDGGSTPGLLATTRMVLTSWIQRRICSSPAARTLRGDRAGV